MGNSTERVELLGEEKLKLKTSSLEIFTPGHWERVTPGDLVSAHKAYSSGSM